MSEDAETQTNTATVPTINPVPDSHYDVVIIGSGPGGYSTALRSAELGAHVALIERDPVVGGTCLNRGCIPTKALITATHAISTARDAARMGVDVRPVGIDFAKLNGFKRDSIDGMTGGLSQLLAQRKVSVFHGLARVSGPGQVEVVADDGSTSTLQATDIVIATGSRSLPLKGLPFSDQVIDSDRALDLERFPERPVIIGAGAVAVEFASIWQAAGSQVTMLIRKDRVMSGWDRRTAVTLTRELKRQGIRIITGSQCTEVRTGGGDEDLLVSYRPIAQTDGEASDGRIGADKVLVAIGRRPNTDQDWFARTGISLDGHGMVVTDPWGRTSMQGIWALGDITPGYHFAHRAFEQGIVIAEAIAGLNPSPVDEATVPQVVFSTPQAASVGLTRQEAQAKEELTDVRETPYPMQGNARMRMSGSNGSLSLVTACRTDQPDVRLVVGIHIVSPEAAEQIAEAEQIVGARTPLSTAARLIHPHPTFSETLGEALLKADGRPLHMR
ncbi:dihydrolipoyl dehydrogenase [Bifidobacterium xylocopae]|uniref:Dihydrolipoyl dehydrogenase n=1 Tax=Bifidobacterium xylocopae TaxID=2493119 RepID=A0A366KF03_9BIFI|nr:dihydrolipoyl dehydrogenase [Bifidobacterium xylocopae]RBP99967.1 dihydrolipoyl dehydrogenase [Bifidobacterium xylocopae]